MRVWPRLRGWLDDDVDGQRLFRHLAGAADAWDAHGPPGQRALPGCPAQPHPGVARPRQPRPERHRGRLPRRLASPCPRPSSARRRPGSRTNAGSTAGCAAPWPASPCCSSWPWSPAWSRVRTADRARRNRDRAESAADLADARRAGAQAPCTRTSRRRCCSGSPPLQVDDSPQAWENLGAALMRTPPSSRVRDAGGAVVSPRGEPGRLAAGRQSTGPARARRGRPALRRPRSSPAPSATAPGERRRVLAGRQAAGGCGQPVDSRGAAQDRPMADPPVSDAQGSLPTGSSAGSRRAPRRVRPRLQRGRPPSGGGSSSATTGRSATDGAGDGLGPRAPCRARLPSRGARNTRSRS